MVWHADRPADWRLSYSLNDGTLDTHGDTIPCLWRFHSTFFPPLVSDTRCQCGVERQRVHSFATLPAVKRAVNVSACGGDHSSSGRVQFSSVTSTPPIKPPSSLCSLHSCADHFRGVCFTSSDLFQSRRAAGLQCSCVLNLSRLIGFCKDRFAEPIKHRSSHQSRHMSAGGSVFGSGVSPGCSRTCRR